MRAKQELPQGYHEILHIDLQKNKKLTLTVNAIALVITLAMVVPMLFVVPIATLLDTSQGIGPYLIRLCALIVGMAVYVFLHELIHGITMKAYGTKKVKYGFTGMYAFAGSEDYYDKKSYIVIALAPIVVWGIVLAVLNCFVPTDYFWVVYFIQIMNISGAAGDLYVTAKFSRLPKDILIRDHGIGMTVYSAEK